MIEQLSTLMDTMSSSIATVSEIVGMEEPARFLGIKIINVSDFLELLLRFALNTSLVFLVVHVLYAKNSQRKDFYFSYLAIGVIVFLLCFLLNNVKLELGFALGLFAIFGIIRYRTDTIPIKEMTYLFIVIGISVVNALANKKVSYVELLFTNSVIFFGLWILENRLMLKQEGSIKLVYEQIENIHMENEAALLTDLKTRTGINISRYEIKKIDFLRDIAEITLYYNMNDTTGKKSSIDKKT
jgi:Domain of unknown function (DUF4956)